MGIHRSNHSIWIADGKVFMANGDDDFYVQEFNSPEQVDDFIAEMIRIRDECFGKVESSNEKTL